MASVHDVAAYVLDKHGEMSAMKLQKLAYYAQAWSLVWDDEPLFPEEFQAWANGPVCPALYQVHRGKFHVSRWPRGKKGALSKKARETVDAVLETYGKFTPAQLSELTHREAPWRDARTGLPPGARGKQPITHAAMAEFYGGLYGG